MSYSPCAGHTWARVGSDNRAISARQADRQLGSLSLRLSITKRRHASPRLLPRLETFLLGPKKGAQMENSSNPEVGATSASKAGARRDEITRQERHDMVWLRDTLLPERMARQTICTDWPSPSGARCPTKI
jgi:hypothetical protein